MNWAKSAELGWESDALKTFERADFKPNDWSICQFGCASYIDIGLRTEITNRVGGFNFGPNPEPASFHESDRYTIIMWEELAARADWAIEEPENCNHAPIVSAETLDLSAKPGRTVSLSGTATDPDGNELTATWWVPAFSCTYKEGKAEGLSVSSESGWNTEFTIPKDAKKGDTFLVNLEVKDNATRPMTRFAQYVITTR
ncbi:hypothetical protein NYZ99_17190 [Maribacter litopenaei]|uniref:Cellulose-binding Sde182 C-terminal domain-containing protein n=1 Tax=Maribacter litopenaei TaxID=2976127 RepID=A0ABY5Y8W7_9FLAO|nr:hypothetical protein [Maribacter litopenaei]UWX54590.1 hypothetical protein NYZ99_17190 [Maribacter litopenaei]